MLASPATKPERKPGKLERLESAWTRAEIELKSSDRLIPLDILLTPSDYFLGTYPCLAFLKSEITTPERIKVKQKAASITFERSIEIVKTQMGAYITFLRNYFNDDDKFLAKISHPDPEIVPKRLKQTLLRHANQTIRQNRAFTDSKHF